MEGELPEFLDREGIIKWAGGTADADKPLKSWMLLNLLKWYEEYFVKARREIPAVRIAAAG